MEQLQVAPSTYYEAKSRPPSKRTLRDNQVAPQLVELFEKNYCVYGRRKLTRAAQKKGLCVGRDQVARLMKREGIRGASRAKKRFTTHADKDALRAADLVHRNFSATRPDQLWVADFTYCSKWSGVVYVAFVTDVFSRRIVGWKAARSMTKELVIDALNMAAWTRRLLSFDQLTCHTDAGAQVPVAMIRPSRIASADTSFESESCVSLPVQMRPLINKRSTGKVRSVVTSLPD